MPKKLAPSIVILYIIKHGGGLSAAFTLHRKTTQNLAGVTTEKESGWFICFNMGLVMLPGRPALIGTFDIHDVKSSL